MNPPYEDPPYCSGFFETLKWSTIARLYSTIVLCIVLLLLLAGSFGCLGETEKFKLDVGRRQEILSFYFKRNKNLVTGVINLTITCLVHSLDQLPMCLK